ncbi:MAG TPA: electron transport complex subunit RsxB [Halioglobus sp.]
MMEFLTQSALISALLALAGMAAVFGALLGYAANRFGAEGNTVVDEIDNLLPQTQCGQCGYPGCRPYAQAIANGDAINKCPPGGEAGIRALANLLHVEPLPLDAAHGEEKPVALVAFIREPECIGCTKCIQACPVDAIIGAAKQMHTVVRSICTGCDLCVDPCPVDCIDMIPRDAPLQAWRWPLPDPLNLRADVIATDSAQGEAPGERAA